MCRHQSAIAGQFRTQKGAGKGRKGQGQTQLLTGKENTANSQPYRRRIAAQLKNKGARGWESTLAV